MREEAALVIFRSLLYIKQLDVSQWESKSAETEYTLFSMPSSNRNGCEPFEVSVQMDGQLVCMELDTRAALMLMSEASFRSKWPNKPLQQSNITVRTYTGVQLKALGSTIVQVRHGEKEAVKLLLLIVPGNGQSLLGRNWLRALKLDWGLIH